MNITDLIQMVGQNIWIYGGSLILVLSILVFVHEWGHYIVARMCGIRVKTFSIGFGKEIWGFTDKNDTHWKISLLPLGGYVQLFGDTDPASASHSDKIEDGAETREMSAAEKKVAFYTKPLWQRAAVVFAGPAINYIFAIAILAGLYMMHGEPVSPPTAAAIVKESSADKYAFKPHDDIISIDGKTIKSFSDIRREMMVAMDQEKHFVVERNGKNIDIYARPERVEVQDRFGFKSTIGVLGIISAEQGILISEIKEIDGKTFETQENIIEELQKRMNTTFDIALSAGEEKQILTIHPASDKNQELGTIEDSKMEALFLSDISPKAVINHTAMTAVQGAIKESYSMTRSSLEALWQMIVGLRSASELGGIIRIGAVAGDMAQQGLIPMILLTALLSINLGFINLLPIPMLDGGHLFFYAIEGIIGRPIPEKILEYAFGVGFIFLVGIMAFANLNDIYQMVKFNL